jgi:hypothetical protein
VLILHINEYCSLIFTMQLYEVPQGPVDSTVYGTHGLNYENEVKTAIGCTVQVYMLNGEPAV